MIHDTQSAHISQTYDGHTTLFSFFFENVKKI